MPPILRGVGLQPSASAFFRVWLPVFQFLAGKGKRPPKKQNLEDAPHELLARDGLAAYRLSARGIGARHPACTSPWDYGAELYPRPPAVAFCPCSVCSVAWRVLNPDARKRTVPRPCVFGHATKWGAKPALANIPWRTSPRTHTSGPLFAKCFITYLL